MDSYPTAGKTSCWTQCKNHKDCSWFSFRISDKVCVQFEQCERIVENSLFISGQKECEYDQGYRKCLKKIKDISYLFSKFCSSRER